MSGKTPLIGEITRYLNRLNQKQQQAVLGVVKTFAEEEHPWRDEKVFNAEMEKRFKEMKTNSVKLMTLDDLEKGARQQYRIRKRNKQ